MGERKGIYKHQWKRIIIGISAVVLLWLGVSVYFRLTPVGFAKQGLRVVAIPILAQLYSEDTKAATLIQKHYWVGDTSVDSSSPLQSWKRIEAQLPGFRFLRENANHKKIQDIPFVYESRDAPYLIELQERYHLHELIREAGDEYEAMLQLGAWIGTRWDHGTDPVPGGITAPHPATIIQAGKNNAKFWCEVAAKVTIQAATALDWPARLVTVSSDGYRWQHAVAELWSNQHAKWFVMDTDFNVVYESNGIPLSAFELCHDALELQKTGQLHVRTIAPPKPSLPFKDLLPFYRYVHIDLRNDWYSRRLRRGSPAGGDLAAWWTARSSLGNILTAKVHVDSQSRFDWPVNLVNIYARATESSSGQYPVIHIGLVGYSPFFKTFQISVNGERWHETKSGQYSLRLLSGQHSIRARLITIGEWIGPISEIQFQFQSSEVMLH